MYDIKHLEEEWKRYKKKKRRPWYLFISALLIIAGSMAGLVVYKDDLWQLLKEKSTKKANLQVQLQIPLQPEIGNETNQSAKIKNESNQSAILINEPISALEIYPPKEKQDTVTAPETYLEENPYDSAKEVPVFEEEATPQASIDQPIPKQEIQKQKIHLNIVETTSISAYQEVEKRFYESRDVEDALFLARNYFNQNKYQKAEYWALQANKINNNIEESWMIFIKSKLKLGRKNEAMHTLTAYIQRTDSKQAKKLLEQIKNGSL